MKKEPAISVFQNPWSFVGSGSEREGVFTRLSVHPWNRFNPERNVLQQRFGSESVTDTLHTLHPTRFLMLNVTRRPNPIAYG